MKFFKLSIIDVLLIILLQITSITQIASLDTYLKITVVEAVNLHCKLNHELFCNPFSEITFKFSSQSGTSKTASCTKSPYFDSPFEYKLDYCEDEEVYINLYQFITPRDQAFLGEGVYEQEVYDQGEIKPGYLGNIILKLNHIPFGTTEDWFMVEESIISDRIVFPSCVKLRISYTSTKCKEGSTLYQLSRVNDPTFKLPIDSIGFIGRPNKIKSNITNPVKYIADSVIPLCKNPFVMIYKNSFTKLTSINSQTQEKEEIGNEDPNYEYRKCKEDRNKDYGYNHASALTYIEENLVYKIVVRTTGKVVNYEELYSNKENFKSSVENFEDFFKKECYDKGLTIEEINNILRLEATKFPTNTNNPYLTDDPDKQPNFPKKLIRNRLNNVYSDTLNNFIRAEDSKNIDNFKDDDIYVSAIGKMTSVIKDIENINKEDETMFEMENQVGLTMNGRVKENEKKIFKIYAWYKWNGGHLGYDIIKKEYLLRRKYLKCYELTNFLPYNIIFHFLDDKCPDNYVCVDPNGVIIPSIGKDPKEIFMDVLKNYGIKLRVKLQPRITPLKPVSSAQSQSLLFVEGHDELVEPSNYNSIINKTKITLGKSKVNFLKEVSKTSFIELKSRNSSTDVESDLDNEELEDKNQLNKLDFERILTEESGENAPNIYIISYNEETIYLNKFDRLYFSRRERIKNKKTVIINKVFECVPIIGEMLQLSNFDKVAFDKKINDEFLKHEFEIFKKYLKLYGADPAYSNQSARILLNLVLCKTDSYKLRYLLNELMEGLCQGDFLSMKIFREILHQVILETLFSLNLLEFEDLQAKLNLIQTFNKKFCFKVYRKIAFVEKMLLLETLKQKVVYMLIQTDSNQKIESRLSEVRNSIPVILKNNKREIQFDEKGNLIYDNSNDYSQHFISDLKKYTTLFSDKNKKEQYGEYKFKQISNKLDEDNTEETIKLNNNKELIKSDEDDVISNFISQRNKLNKSNGEKDSDAKLELEVAKDKERDDKNDLAKASNKKLDYDEESEFKDFESTSKKTQLANSGIENTHLKEEDTSNISFIQTNSKSTTISTTSKNNSSKQLTNEEIDSILKDKNNLVYNNKEIFTSNNAPTDSAISKSVLNNAEVKNILKENKDSKIITDTKPINTIYQVNKVVNKKVELNKNNKTKALITSKLLDEKTFNDMLNQGVQGKETETENSGLFNVLKNIQNKPCSEGYICLEIGTIYGDFNMFNTKNITLPIEQKENMHLIVKPIVIIQKEPQKALSMPPPQAPKVIQTDDDCDLAQITQSVTEQMTPDYKFKNRLLNNNKNTFNNENDNLMFLEKANKIKITNPLELNNKKFYRKVQIGLEVVVSEIFREGINIVIINRDKNYKKLYEKTFNTDFNAQDSEDLACLIKDTPYDRIIVLTAIGRWMGKVTPNLMTEIKQIGGPDLKNLITPDNLDASQTKHSFVLIGRRGLCRYNGIFKINNYDISQDIKDLLPNLNSDPGDCGLFENVNYENKVNISQEKLFFHQIDSSLLLNLSNDSRFAYDAPTIISVTPNNGPLLGGIPVRINGLKFKTNQTPAMEVTIRGVICSEIEVISEEIIECRTRSAEIIGSGLGNVVVNGKKRSPINTCLHFKYLEQVIVELKVEKIQSNDSNTTNDNNNISSEYNRNSVSSMFKFKQIKDNEDITNPIKILKTKSAEELQKTRIGGNENEKFDYSFMGLNRSLKKKYDKLYENVEDNSFPQDFDKNKRNRFRKIVEGLNKIN